MRKIVDAKTQARKYNLVDNDFPFIVTESFKIARTNLMFALASSDKKPVFFTSANQGEGKSTICVNTANSFASMGSKVLLIDADLRRPTVHKYFKLKNTKGLSSVLGYFNKVHDCINQNAMPNLDVMTSGPLPPNPAELLSSKAMSDLLTALSDYYDYIFIDTPPVNVVTDSQLINPNCAGCIFVVRRNVTKHNDISEALRRIKLANGNILGFMTINPDLNKGKKYHYRYK